MDKEWTGSDAQNEATGVETAVAKGQQLTVNLLCCGLGVLDEAYTVSCR